VRVAIGADEGTLQPYTYVSGSPGYSMLTLVYDTLYILDADNLPRPWLASGDTVSAGGTVHTLALIRGVKWHDGTPFTSADVKFSFEFYKRYTHSRWTPRTRGITGIETPNDATVVLTLGTPEPALPVSLLADVPIIPQHLWEGVHEPKTFDNNVGTGPYTLAEYKADQFYRFVANPEYFAGRPAVDEIVMPIVKEPSTVFASLRSGQLDSTTRSLAPELVKDFQASPDLRVQRGPGFASSLLLFNAGRAPWDKREVRQAVGLAIDNKQLVETVLLGYGAAGAPGWIHPASPYYDPAATGGPNPAGARALLDGLGYKDTDGDGVREAAGKKMEAELLVSASNPTGIRTAELIAAALKEIGISVKVSAMESTSVDARVWPGFDVAKGRDFDLALWGWTAPVMIDPFRIVGLVASDPRVGTLNVGGYKSEAADKVADEPNGTSDPEQQKVLIRRLSAAIGTDLPFITLYYPDGVYVTRPAAYDQWVYQKGQGIFGKLSFLPPAARPAART
jgi:peptide/nickel transport system substrate-binding protein